NTRNMSNLNAGFTLVELIVTLMVFSILSLMIYHGLRQAGISWNRSLNHNESIQTRYVVDQQVRWILQQMRPTNSSSTDQRADFIGGPQEMSFTGPLPWALSEGGLYRISLFYNHDKKSVSIVWGREDGLIDDYRNRTDAKSIEVWQNVEGVAFSYKSDKSSKKLPVWHDKDMPSSIHIRVDSNQVFVASYAPLITQSANCRFDIVSRSCRD
ncbi:MAG: hypothetical protein COB29_14710, partial [Sulfitobacter sp.]